MFLPGFLFAELYLCDQFGIFLHAVGFLLLEFWQVLFFAELYLFGELSFWVFLGVVLLALEVFLVLDELSCWFFLGKVFLTLEVCLFLVFGVADEVVAVCDTLLPASCTCLSGV